MSSFGAMALGGRERGMPTRGGKGRDWPARDVADGGSCNQAVLGLTTLTMSRWRELRGRSQVTGRVSVGISTREPHAGDKIRGTE